MNHVVDIPIEEPPTGGRYHSMGTHNTVYAYRRPAGMQLQRGTALVYEYLVVLSTD